MKKLRKVLSLVSAVSLLITSGNISTYAVDEQASLDDMILAKNEIYSNNFENITDEEIGEWNSNYYHDPTKYFRTYFDNADTDGALYSREDGTALYLCKGKTSYSARAMQYIVTDEEGTLIEDGVYSLSYDFYPAKGTNILTLVSQSEVIEGMATFKSGTQLASKTFSASSREWLKVNVLVDLNNDKATIDMVSDATGESVYSKEITYSKNDLRVFNFYMNGTSVCSAANAAVLDNISFSELLLKPEIKFSITDRNGEVKTDFEQAFSSVETINVDFGAEMNPQTLNEDSVLLRNKEDGTAVSYSYEYYDGVYVITPEKGALEELNSYIVEVLDTVQYDEQYGTDKFVFSSSAEFRLADSRVNPTVSFVCSDGEEETDFSQVACAISQIKLDFGADMDADSFTNEALKIVDVENDEELAYDGQYLEGEGIYIITPATSFEDGKGYILELSENIKYATGREILEYSYEFTIPAYDYYKQDFNGMMYESIDKWSDAEGDANVVLDDFGLSPVVPHYGASVWPNIGYDGTDAFYFGICKDGTYYIGNGAYGSFDWKNDYPNRNVDIPIGKTLQSAGVYSFTCDYYPSNGTESFIIRGNQKFPVGYNVDNGIRIGNFGFIPDGREREWCTLNITVDLDEDTVSVSIISKETGEIIYQTEASYTQQLGVISLYMEGTSISSRANSAIIDNLELKRETTFAPIFKDSDISYYAGNILQSEKNSVNYLTDRIEIKPEHDIKMSSVTSGKIYLTEGLNSRISCRLRYEDGKISLYPRETLKPDTEYVVHLEGLENLDGYAMHHGFDQSFTTSASKMDFSVISMQDKSLDEIISSGEFTVSYSVANSEDKDNVVYFAAAYYSEDYGKLLKFDCVEKQFAPNELESDGKVTFSLPSDDVKNIQVLVMDSFGKMTQLCEAKDLK